MKCPAWCIPWLLIKGKRYAKEVRVRKENKTRRTKAAVVRITTAKAFLFIWCSLLLGSGFGFFNFH